VGVGRRVEDVGGEGGRGGGVGKGYEDWGQYAKAQEYYEKSLAIFRELKDPKGEGNALFRLGSLYRARGEYDGAMAIFQLGLEIYVKIGVPTAWPKNLIGNLYLDRGELENA